MARERLHQGEKPAYFVGSSYKDLTALPKEVQVRLGDAIGAAQFGGMHAHAKPWKGLGTGVLEVVEDYRSDTYRAVYTVRFEKAIYILHVFQKKSKRGIKTNLTDRNLIASRIRDAERIYKETYG